MPLALEPGETFRVILQADREKPAEGRPAFLVRHLSARQYRVLDAVMVAVASVATGAAALDSVLAAIAPHIAGWENLAGPDGHPIPFDVGNLDGVLTMREVYELAWAVVAGQRPDTDEKKGLPSPSPGGAATSAADAGAGR